MIPTIQRTCMLFGLSLVGAFNGQPSLPAFGLHHQRPQLSQNQGSATELTARRPLSPPPPAFAPRTQTPPPLVPAPRPDAKPAPPPVAAVLRPARSTRTPPAELVPLPTATRAAPPRPAVAAPVPAPIRPLLPLFADPEAKRSAPLAPAAPAFALETRIEPPLVAVPSPLQASADPPT